MVGFSSGAKGKSRKNIAAITNSNVISFKKGMNWRFICSIKGDKNSISTPEKYIREKNGTKGIRLSKLNAHANR